MLPRALKVAAVFGLGSVFAFAGPFLPEVAVACAPVATVAARANTAISDANAAASGDPLANPGTYVAVHDIQLIEFTFGGRLQSGQCTGQRGLVGPVDRPRWDSNQLRLIYQYADGREAAFDIHTSWVTPDNFPGYVEQEVQFRFDNGVWNAHSRKRGVECTIEGSTPFKRKTTMNNHYNGTFAEPLGLMSQRGYGIEVIERFVREVAYVEHG